MPEEPNPTLALALQLGAGHYSRFEKATRQNTSFFSEVALAGQHFYYSDNRDKEVSEDVNCQCHEQASLAIP
jgi:hypothetical protein